MKQLGEKNNLIHNKDYKGIFCFPLLPFKESGSFDWASRICRQKSPLCNFEDDEKLIIIPTYSWFLPYKMSQ
jgi:hypothetical protein